jgi:polyhydroxyalkanoate synthesis repressor PhaR
MPRTIKKYANRRLYDTHASRHVTLEGVRQLIAGGEDIVVVDDTTGHDITRSILLQVITGQEDTGLPVLSTAFLRHLIRFHDGPKQELLAQHLERSMEAFLAEHAADEDPVHEPRAPAVPVSAGRGLPGPGAERSQPCAETLLAGAAKKP